MNEFSGLKIEKPNCVVKTEVSNSRELEDFEFVRIKTNEAKEIVVELVVRKPYHREWIARWTFFEQEMKYFLTASTKEKLLLLETAINILKELK